MYKISSTDFNDLSSKEQAILGKRNLQIVNNSVRCAAIVGSVPEMELLAASLTQKQCVYAQGRAVGLSRSAAQRLAGYVDKNKPMELEELDNTPVIAKFVANVREAFQRRVGVERDDVISGVMDAVRSAANSTELVNAWREMGKLIGAYAPEVKEIKISASELTEQKLSQMPAEQLARMALMDEYILPVPKRRNSSDD